VAVFDFYNVLTASNNHHRFINGAVEHIINTASNTSAYASDPWDSHPNATGNQKATGEFIDLLNVFYDRWNGGGENASHKVNAGPDQSVTESDTVTLDGSNSTDPDDSIDTYQWSQVSGTSATLSDTTAIKPSFSQVVSSDQLTSSDFTYKGAFRLPSDFNWGSRGISYYPSGDGGSGSLLVTGFDLLYDPAHPGESCWDPAWDCYAFFGEVAIPTPTVEANWEDLPVATLATKLTSFDCGLASSVHREYVSVTGIEYVPRRGSQTSDKLYGSINLWYAEGVAGENTFPTVWFSNLDGTDAQGMFHVGPEETPYHARKMGSYLFSVPAWYADQYLGGRTLITGRSRGTPVNCYEEITTNGGSQGPTLFAFHAWDSNKPTGDLDALPVLYYRVKFPGCAGPNVGDPSVCDYPGFTMCDEWNGGAFVESGAKRAIILLGYKGLGENCYDEPPVECNDPCNQYHGFHCDPYERQVIFYDIDELGEAALGNRDPWSVVPYSTWRPEEFYLRDSAGHTCGDVGGMAFDTDGRRVFMIEKGFGGHNNENAGIVHVWTTQ